MSRELGRSACRRWRTNVSVAGLSGTGGAASRHCDWRLAGGTGTSLAATTAGLAASGPRRPGRLDARPRALVRVAGSAFIGRRASMTTMCRSPRDATNTGRNSAGTRLAAPAPTSPSCDSAVHWTMLEEASLLLLQAWASGTTVGRMHCDTAMTDGSAVATRRRACSPAGPATDTARNWAGVCVAGSRVGEGRAAIPPMCRVPGDMTILGLSSATARLAAASEAAEAADRAVNRTMSEVAPSRLPRGWAAVATPCGVNSDTTMPVARSVAAIGRAASPGTPPVDLAMARAVVRIATSGLGKMGASSAENRPRGHATAPGSVSTTTAPVAVTPVRPSSHVAIDDRDVHVREPAAAAAAAARSTTPLGIGLRL